MTQIRQALDRENLFKEKRFQSFGNIFNLAFNAEFELFKDDFVFEITRVSVDSAKDMRVLGYNCDYLKDENFHKANIRLNYVLMKNTSLQDGNKRRYRSLS